MINRNIEIVRRRYRVFNIVVGLCLAIFASAVALLYFWLFDNRPVIEVVDARAAKPRFAAGESITVEWTIIRRRNCKGDAVRYLVDARGTIWPLAIGGKPLFDEGETSVTFAFDMPLGAPPGKYEYHSIINWRCNPLTEKRQETPALKFEVLP